MIVHRHAEKTLVALTQKMPQPASVYLDRLRKMEPPPHDVAIEVCRMTMFHGSRAGSNGDSVVVIVRQGKVITAMLRRSWSQRFDPETLRVDEVQRWTEGKVQWNARDTRRRTFVETPKA